jgi:exopolysaccharide biosynthesis polyprenyl glycosylphosphotransferase
MLFSPLPRLDRPQLRISERRLLLMAGDTFAVLAAVLVSIVIWSIVADYPLDARFILEQSIWFIVLAPLWLVLASANDFYELRLAAKRGPMLQRLMVITSQLIVVYLIVFFFSPRDALPRLFILYYGILSFTLIAVWRLVNPALIGWASEPRKVLVIGADDGASEMIRALGEQSEREYTVRGVIGEQDRVGQVVEGVPVIGCPTDLMNYVARERISELILTSTRDLSGEMFQAVMDAYQAGVSLVPMPVLYERITGRVPVAHVGSNWTVVLPLEAGDGFNPYPLLKRFGEVSAALLGFIPVALSFPLIALAIYIDSPGPIFFSQERVGLNGRSFRVYKYRTMIPDAEKNTGAVFSDRDDPRKTRIGRFLRRTRIDELPQLWNILRGDMSLIGPRPERPEHVQRLQQSIPFYRTRLIVRPGLTGWAQVMYGYGSTDDDALVKLQYDLFYIRHRSLLLDLNILVKTVGRVLRMSGV